ncbi:LuxR C-terminal-related transcriptional regulator [Oceanobacter sp. 3_MG-2023]|uniref:LuxR C-terminal-related transcriptional regulator n=1 Tax=Oceanobacter sp. 3_MG-2023 TaxID=3062622 RepID=UPI0027365BE7|nr:LuxR C-terminal-related transcriptional regulator [Oceanobacter sp. 3_MG-2023]MDP2505762.1 LuxR C-terminal-related transcriptional regulator [Oceanobacter sp. 3_MG-2023]
MSASEHYSDNTSLAPLVDILASPLLLARRRPPLSLSPSIKRLDYALDMAAPGLVWIHAPAGFGKTQYLLEWYQRWQGQGLNVLWFNCEVTDDAALLLQALLAGDGSAEAMALARRCWPLEEPPTFAVEQLESILLNWLALIDRPLCLCIDNLQNLDDTGWQLVQLLIRRAPESCFLALATRRAPRGACAVFQHPSMLAVGMHQLSFTRQQQQRWLEQHGLQLAPEEQALLDRRLAGWPAAMSIWLACVRAYATLDVMAPGLGVFELQDYWLSEVVAEQSAECRLLLQQLSVLEQGCEDLLRRLNHQDASAGIKELVRNGFLQPLEQSGWVSIAAPFQRLVAATVTEVQREQWHRQAFYWYGEHQQPVRALEHAQKTAMVAELAPWMESQAEALMASLDIAGLIDWCELAGEQVLNRSPRLMQLACWAWLVSHRQRRADAMLRQLIHRQLLNEADLAALQGYQARLKGQHKSAMNLCKKALAGLPGDRYSSRFLMCSTLTYLSLGETDLDNARAWNRQAMQLARQHGVWALEALAMFDQARIELHRGHLEFSLDIVDASIQLLRDKPGRIPVVPMGRLMVYRAFLLWVTRRETETLPELLQQGSRYCREGADVIVCYGYGLQAMMAAADGEYHRALGMLDEVERLMHGWGVESDTYLWLILVKANVWISQGKHHRAQGCLVELLDGQPVAQLSRPDVFPLLPDFAAATQARLYLVCGRFNECLAEVDEWLRCNSSPMIMMLIQLIRAAALRGRNQIAESQHIFNQVGHQLRQEGISMSFKAWLPELYAPARETEASITEPVRVQLSDREHDVLRKIAEGLSNQDIASQLFISLHTVKTHARKINIKLGVKNRTQALNKAKELLLL